MKDNRVFSDGQLAKAIYLRNMSAMKRVLDLGEFKIGKKDSEDYKYFKKVVMDETYNAMTDLFSAMEGRGMLTKCECGTSIRHGYKPCQNCNGAGYRNSEEFLDWVLDDEPEDEDEKNSDFHGQPPNPDGVR